MCMNIRGKEVSVNPLKQQKEESQRNCTKKKQEKNPESMKLNLTFLVGQAIRLYSHPLDVFLEPVKESCVYSFVKMVSQQKKGIHTLSLV